MKLNLVKLPTTTRGIYGPNKDQLGANQRWAHPDLAEILARLVDARIDLRFSDIYRSAKSSQARRAEFAATGGAQLAKRPGESPHNYGLAVDLDVSAALADNHTNKKGLDLALQNYGLHCHRLDHDLGAECWHYNALGPNASQWTRSSSSESTSRAIEAKIASIYGEAWKLTPEEIRAALKLVGVKNVRELQAGWDLEVDGIAGPKTQRLLSYLTAETPF